MPPRSAGVYVHFPWCLAKCPYCDFVSYAQPDADHAGYADAVLREIDARAALFEGRRIESIFFGGGTPSLWKPQDLGRVLARVHEMAAPESPTGTAGAADAGDGTSPASPGRGRNLIEVTVECNPTSLDEDKARALVDAGVNRLSIGVQSLRDERLRFLGRLHDARGAVAAVAGAIRAGVPRVSADLIFGVADQSPAAAREEALELADIGLEHISCYQLTIEPGTRFGELARRGRLPLADDGQVADAFVAVEEALATRGLGHYEISNYARPGQEARHNLGYWHGDEYLGLGCGAYGFVRTERRGSPGAGVRWRNGARPEAYVEGGASTATGAFGVHNAPEAEQAAACEELDAETLLRERIMLGLRLAEGFDLTRAAEDLGIAGWTPERSRVAARLTERGRVVRDGPVLRIPPRAWLWTDDTAARLF